MEKPNFDFNIDEFDIDDIDFTDDGIIGTIENPISIREASDLGVRIEID